MEDWYQITKTIIVANKGGYLLNTYGYSPSRALAAVYPQYKWEPWKFLNVPKYFWQHPTNQRNYLNSLGNKLGVKTLEDWYMFLMKLFEIIKDLDYWIDSILQCIDVYNLLILNILGFLGNFHVYQEDFGQKSKIKRYFLIGWVNSLCVKEYSDWYNISKVQINEYGGNTAVSIHGSIHKTLKSKLKN
jgi:hypothetical protein